MIIVTGTFRVPPSMMEVVIPAMEEMITASRAEQGCIEYAYGFDALDKGLVRVTERWRDREALEKHFRTAHIAEWRAQFSALAISERDLYAFETTDDGFHI